MTDPIHKLNNRAASNNICKKNVTGGEIYTLSYSAHATALGYVSMVWFFITWNKKVL